MSSTPRTDAQINGKPCTQFSILAGDPLRDALVPSDFARQLERELNVANARIKHLIRLGLETSQYGLTKHGELWEKEEKL